MKFWKTGLDVAIFVGWVLGGSSLVQAFHREFGVVFDVVGCGLIWLLVRVQLREGLRGG